jgi:hypothetical protein
MHRLPRWPIVIVAGLVYPLVVGIGAPRFPKRSECIRPVTHAENIDVVFGRFSSPLDAEKRLGEAYRYGFRGITVGSDGCGHFVVVLSRVPTLRVAKEVRAEARSVGLEPSFEQSP